jgi:hypothetical protein
MYEYNDGAAGHCYNTIDATESVVYGLHDKIIAMLNAVCKDLHAWVIEGVNWKAHNFLLSSYLAPTLPLPRRQLSSCLLCIPLSLTYLCEKSTTFLSKLSGEM